MKKLSQECEFEGSRSSLIRDVIIMGNLDNKLKERLLRKPNLTRENAIKHSQAAKETKQHVRELPRQIESEKNRKLMYSSEMPKHNLDHLILLSQISLKIASSVGVSQ